jgi:hypothetical protein
LPGQQRQFETGHAQIGVMPFGLSPEWRLLPEKLIVGQPLKKAIKQVKTTNSA